MCNVSAATNVGILYDDLFMESILQWAIFVFSDRTGLDWNEREYKLIFSNANEMKLFLLYSHKLP